MNAASSNSSSPGLPMKFVATPRPEKNAWKSIVGPLIVALRPPAHSTCATLRPLRSADCAIDSAWRTFASNAAVRFANGWPFRWNVLFVEPWTRRPRARREAVPAGAGVRRRLREQAVAASRTYPSSGTPTSSAIRPCRRVALDDVLPHAVGGEEHRLVGRRLVLVRPPRSSRRRSWRHRSRVPRAP